MNGASRDRAIAAFKRDPAVRLLIANPAAAREGLTLTEAQTAIYLDRTFNLVDFLQSQDRIHRMSQTQPCEIVLLIAQNTIDEFIDFSLAQKHRLARYTQGDTETISTDDLALSKPDVLRALLLVRMKDEATPSYGALGYGFLYRRLDPERLYNAVCFIVMIDANHQDHANPTEDLMFQLSAAALGTHT